MKVTLQRNRTLAAITMFEGLTTAFFDVVQITLTYKTGSCVIIQRVDKNGWNDFIKSFWTGSQYTPDEIGEMLDQLRDVDAMNDMDKGPVRLDFREPSMLTEQPG